MNEILHANIFFIIASVATVVFSILACFILYHVLKIVRSIRTIMERIEAGSEAIAEDVAHARALMANGGMVSKIFQFIMGTSRKRRHKNTRENSDD